MTDRRDIDLPDDPTGIDQPHDVLAAEEFAMPTRSAGDIPPDPSGIQEPPDVLAAEEFAMPAPDEARVTPSDGGRRPSVVRLIAIKAAAALAVALAAWRLVRRKRRDR